MFLSRSVLALALLSVCAGSALAAQAATAPRQRQLSLREALDLALRTDPAVLSAMATRDRGELAVLRAQLDRFSLNVSSFLTEQWQAANLGGAAPSPTCAAALPTQAFTGDPTLVAPVQLYSVQGGTVGSPTQAQCLSAMGQYIQPDAITQGFLGQFNLSANLQVPVFSGFRVTANVDHARHVRDAAVASVHDAQRTVALAALRAYWTVRRLEVQQRVSEEAIARYNQSVAVVTARVRAGLAAQADINRIETRRQAEISRLADLVGSAAEMREQLAVALGLGGTTLILNEPVELPSPPPGESSDVDSFLATAMKERPDLRSAEMTRQAASDFVRFQLSNYYPQLTFNSLLQFSNNPFNPLIGARDINSVANPFANITGSIFVGGTISFTLFDTLNTWTGVRDARLDHHRLTEEEHRIGRMVESDVRTLHARLLHYYAMRDPLVRTRDIAHDSLDITERRYKNGDVAILDFIDAQVELLNAEINLANSAASIAQTWGELYLATGRMPP